MNDNEKFWKHKLMAFLHDPPCKALDFSPVHEEQANLFQKAALPGEDSEWYKDINRGLKDSDWFAAEADRLNFAKGQHLTKFGEHPEFKHPLGQSTYTFDEQSIPTNHEAESLLQDAAGGIKVDEQALPKDQFKQLFFFYWRRWMEETIHMHKGRCMAFFPADTRIPDHTIWNHIGLASAFQACRVNESIKPAMLLFQLGPVQDFIAQARSTRDLWSGSYLLSYLTGSALKAISDQLGPDNIIYPSLRAQGVFDLLNQDMFRSVYYKRGETETDSLWERLYHSGDEDELVRKTKKLLNPTLPNRFLALVPQGEERKYANIAEQAIKTSLNEVSTTCLKAFINLLKDTSVDFDESSITQRWERQVALFPQTTWAATPLDSASKWQEIYKKVSELLAARRNTRDFQQFDTDKDQRGTPKDALTGKEEVIVKKEIWERLTNTKNNDAPFKEKERPYGAITIIKRLWCRVETENGLFAKTKVSETIFKKALNVRSLQEIACVNDAGIGGKDDDGEDVPNNPYLAIIALDGDQIGKWLSGDNMPLIKEQVADSLKDKVDQTEKRRLTPSYHMQFSEALTNFATHLADRVVNEYKGKLIYAGGDDVLAVLPADKALSCARDLRAVFQGRVEALFEPQRRYKLGILQNGFVMADEEYPLIVPGPAADASCGIAVAHYKHPLQAIVREAHAAEHRAKDKYAKTKDGEYLGGAFAFSLIKRSGETIHWGARWESAALETYIDFTLKTKSEELSGRFAYTLAEILAPYKLSIKSDMDMKEIIQREFEHIQKQQSLKKGVVIEKACDYLNELNSESYADFSNLFLTSAFINRERGKK